MRLPDWGVAAAKGTRFAPPGATRRQAPSPRASWPEHQRQEVEAGAAGRMHWAARATFHVAFQLHKVPALSSEISSPRAWRLDLRSPTGSWQNCATTARFRSCRNHRFALDRQVRRHSSCSSCTSTGSRAGASVRGITGRRSRLAAAARVKTPAHGGHRPAFSGRGVLLNSIEGRYICATPSPAPAAPHTCSAAEYAQLATGRSSFTGSVARLMFASRSTGGRPLASRRSALDVSSGPPTVTSGVNACEYHDAWIS